MAQQYHLVSSVTCPWVQRSVIVMRAKGVDFDVTYINLREKPDWFLKISPHGKVPVLKLADGTALFESNAIAEYLDEVIAPQLHPADPVLRAKNRAWTDFLPTFAWGPGINNVSYAKDRETLDAAMETAKGRVKPLEEALAQRGNDGPYFNGPDLSLVDCAYGPFFQRFMIAERHLRSGLLDAFPLVKAWAETLLADDRITGAVPDNFAEEFDKNLERRGALAFEIMSKAAAE